MRKVPIHTVISKYNSRKGSEIFILLINSPAEFIKLNEELKQIIKKKFQ